MSSTTRLLVLGVVRLFQPVHGYEVRRELLSWRAQEWASVKPGSIYNALKTLTREGYLEVVGTDVVRTVATFKQSIREAMVVVREREAKEAEAQKAKDEKQATKTKAA